MNASLFAVTSFAVLLSAGVVHVVDRSRFREVLMEHGVVPRRLIWPVAGAVAAAELAIGSAGVAAAAVSGTLAQPLALAAGALFGAFTAYAALLLSRGAAAPCGCAAADYPVNVWVVVRAAILALASIAAALAPHFVAITAMPTWNAAVTVAAALTFSTLLWVFPDALADPSQMPLVRTALANR
jgi:hypothetical protein